MDDPERSGGLAAAEDLSATVRAILGHLCEGACHTYGAVL